MKLYPFRKPYPFRVTYTTCGERCGKGFTKINYAIKFANQLDGQGYKNIGIGVEGIGFTFMAFSCYLPETERMWIRVNTTRHIVMRGDLLTCQQTSVSSSTIKTPTEKNSNHVNSVVDQSPADLSSMPAKDVPR